MSTRMSQREARRWKQRALALEQARNANLRAWASEWVGGVCIGSYAPTESVVVAVETARKLGHPVVVTTSQGKLQFWGVKP